MIVFFNYDFLFFILFFFLSFHFHLFTFHFFFSFFFFLLFSSTQVSSPLSFIFFFTSRTFQQLICFTSKREREREREREGCSFAAPPSREIEVAERTKPVEINVHHAALPRLLPYRCSSSSPPRG